MIVKKKTKPLYMFFSNIVNIKTLKPNLPYITLNKICIIYFIIISNLNISVYNFNLINYYSHIYFFVDIMFLC